jgi:lipooligosaccharide transport system ATP-binding protein
VAEGSPRELIARYVEREVVELRFAAGSQDGAVSKLAGLGERVEELADRILIGTGDGDATVAAVHERGVQPESVLIRRSTLEDVFLSITGRTLVD